jgi:sarcosine oxidase gamma subunit
MARLCMILLLIAAVLGGCRAGGGREPAPPVPTATLSPTTTLVSALPRQVGTDGGYQVFEVTPQQYELISQRVHQVIVRQKLYDQGVRFGAGVNQGKHMVLIDPGFSGLTARQILNRLLGNP